jgi:hypothetical protein
MTHQPRRQVHTGEIFRTARDIWLFWIIDLIAAVAAFYAAWKLLDDAQRLAAVFSGCVFVLVFLILVYENVRRSGDDLDALSSGSQQCRIQTGPHHAQLRPDGSNWSCDGVVWLGISSEPGSHLAVEMTIPRNIGIDLRSQAEIPYIWRILGTSAQGETTYALEVSKSEALTPLGQIAIHSIDAEQGRSIRLEARGADPHGSALHDRIEIGLIIDVPMVAI